MFFKNRELVKKLDYYIARNYLSKLAFRNIFMVGGGECWYWSNDLRPIFFKNWVNKGKKVINFSTEPISSKNIVNWQKKKFTHFFADFTDWSYCRLDCVLLMTCYKYIKIETSVPTYLICFERYDAISNICDDGILKDHISIFQ